MAERRVDESRVARHCAVRSLWPETTLPRLDPQPLSRLDQQPVHLAGGPPSPAVAHQKSNGRASLRGIMPHWQFRAEPPMDLDLLGSCMCVCTVWMRLQITSTGGCTTANSHQSGIAAGSLDGPQPPPRVFLMPTIEACRWHMRAIYEGLHHVTAVTNNSDGTAARRGRAAMAASIAIAVAARTMATAMAIA